MPQVDDYDPEDDDAGMGGSRRLTGGATNQTAAQPSAQVESQHVGWDRFVNANADVAEREAGKLKSRVQGSVDKATQGRDAAVGQQASAIGQNYAKEPVAAFGSVRQPQGEASASAFGQKAFTPKPAPAPAVQSIAQQAPAPAASRVTPTAAPTPRPTTVDPNRLKTDTSTGKPVTSAFGLSGASDLKGTLGDAGWSALIGDTMKAQQEAGALGSTSGVQALLGQQATGFDAGLIGGAGGQDFRDLANKYGGNALGKGLQDANKGAVASWEQLMGDLEGAGLSRDREIQTANDLMNELDAAQQSMNATAQGGAAKPKWAPEGYDTLDSFMGSQDGLGGFYQDAHAGGMALSPADWLTRALGEAGYNGQNASEMFGNQFSGGAFNNEWWTSNMRTALGQIQNEYGREALQKFWDSLTPEMWAAYQQFGNAGALAREIRAWLESAGFAKQSTPRNDNQVQQQGATAGEASQGTTAEEETARNQAYADGWGTQYDEQFRSGNRKPVKP